MRPYGKTNLVGVVLLVAGIYGAWWGVTYLPARLDNIDVKAHAEAAYNQAKIQNLNEVRNTLMQNLNGPNLGWHMAEDEAGVLVKKPGLGVKNEDVLIERDEVLGTITIRVDYDRLILLRPMDKQTIKHFTVQHVGPIR